MLDQSAIPLYYLIIPQIMLYFKHILQRITLLTLCFSHTYILLLQKTAFFRLAPFYQPQRSIPPERSRKHNFKSKICFSLLNHISFFSSTPQSKRKNTPSQSSCDSNLVSINFCIATQKSAENEVYRPTFG